MTKSEGSTRFCGGDPAGSLLQLDAPVRAIRAPYHGACAIAEQANRDH